MFKYLILLVFTIFFNLGEIAAQANIPSEFVTNSINNIERKLVKHSPTLSLSDAQKLHLQVVFAEKEQKYLSVDHSKLSKMEIGKMNKELDDEFAPRVQNVLSIEQKIALNRKRASTK